MKHQEANNDSMDETKNPQASSSPSFTVRELTHVRGVKVYKVISGTSANLKDYYRQACRQHAAAPVSDWSALYTQFQAEHALGTIPYRWERDSNERATLVEATIQTPLNIVVLDGPIFYESQWTGQEKAKLIKERLFGMNDLDLPLLEGLGRQGKVAMVRETADEWELILPQNIVETAELTERAVAGFQRHRHLPVTAQWCRLLGDDADDEPLWQKWIEGESHTSSGIPDLSTDFLVD